ncbi:MAG TPA: hypothetical protein VK835_14990 [Bacteroidia bacterium]|nr:hypothetical protein [Bacteroidia bacterium]
MDNKEIIEYLVSKLKGCQKELEDLEGLFPYNKFSIKLYKINDIISIKELLISYNEKYSVYTDIKKCFLYYIKASEEQEHDYSEISLKFIENKIKAFPLKEKISLLSFFMRNLKKNGHDEIASNCKELIHAEKIRLCWQEKGLTNVIKFISIWSTQTMWHLVITILVFFLFTTIALLPAPLICMEWIEVKKESFSSNYFINHLANTISLLFDFDEGVKVKGNNIGGVILIMFSKVIFISIIINYFVKEIIEKIKIKN